MKKRILALLISGLAFQAQGGPPGPGQANPGDIPMSCHLQSLDLARPSVAPLSFGVYLDGVYGVSSQKKAQIHLVTGAGSRFGVTAISSSVGRTNSPFRSIRLGLPVAGGSVVEVFFLGNEVLTDNLTLKNGDGRSLPIVGSCRISFH